MLKKNLIFRICAMKSFGTSQLILDCHDKLSVVTIIFRSMNLVSHVLVSVRCLVIIKYMAVIDRS